MLQWGLQARSEGLAHPFYLWDALSSSVQISQGSCRQ